METRASSSSSSRIDDATHAAHSAAAEHSQCGAGAQNASRTDDDHGDDERTTTTASTTTTRPKKDFEEEWFFLQNLYMQWRDKDPHKHVLYAKAIGMVADNRSLDYYQGVYHTLCAMHPVLDLILAPGGSFCDDPQRAMTEILQLQIGHTIGLMLQRWPQHLVPKITDAGKPRARRSALPAS